MTRSMLLTPPEMAEADRLTIAGGTPGIDLMERAGAAVASEFLRAFPDARHVAILAGPGNNGGDAFVAARFLRTADRNVRVFALGDVSGLAGDARLAADAWDGEVALLRDFEAGSFDAILDGLFGAGLARDLDGPAKRAIDGSNAAGTPVVAIDLPSGISGWTGGVCGTAMRAALTVTFFRRKPGHLLEPGRSYCGRTVVAEIGIDANVLEAIGPRLFANDAALWPNVLAAPAHAGHKYDRGHAVVFSGGMTTTGAARMAATAALRVGAGLVTVFSPAAALMVNAAHLTAIMLKRCEDAGELAEMLGDERLNAFVVGPGFGIGEKARAFASALLAAGRHVVVDADAISSFKDDPSMLFEAVHTSTGTAVLTPHDGEFARLFPDLAAAGASKVETAREAARRSGATIVFKGSDTVIAAPDGRAAINETGSPFLATAGSGDVLAGMIGGLLAQKQGAFEAAAAAVWMHGRAAQLHGPGLIAEDLPHLLPDVWAELAAAR